MRKYVVTLVAIASLSTASPAWGLSLEEVGTFEQPVYVTSPPDNADSLFVLERKGTIKLVEEETIGTYLDLRSLVSCCAGERGAASLAFAPDFATSRKLYVAYTAAESIAQDEGDLVVEELLAPANPDDAFALRRVLTIPHGMANFHNGGQLQFGPDGYLYLSVGDALQYEASQDPESALGKILRFDPDPRLSLPFTPPPDNPFLGGSVLGDLVWAMGLRNPFRFSFDRLSGDLIVGDVGENTREELDWAPSPAAGTVGGKGANYGWSCFEGSLPGLGAASPSCVGRSTGEFVAPVFEYGHVMPGEKGAICSGSIIAGYVVRDPDPSLGDLYGRYVYADFCTGDIRTLRLPSAGPRLAVDDCSLGLRLPSARPVSFGEDAAGRVYVASLAGGVFRIAGPAFEGCPSSPSSTETRTSSTPTPPATSRYLRLRAARLAGRPNRVLIAVFLSPCEGQAERTVQLRRGSRPSGSKRIGSDCKARFYRRVLRRSTFRARLVPEPGEEIVISPRLALSGPLGAAN